MIIYISEGVPLFPCFFLLTFLAIPEINLNILSQEIAQLEVNKKVPQAIRASTPPSHKVQCQIEGPTKSFSADYRKDRKTA